MVLPVLASCPPELLLFYFFCFVFVFCFVFGERGQIYFQFLLFRIFFLINFSSHNLSYYLFLSLFLSFFIFLFCLFFSCYFSCYSFHFSVTFSVIVIYSVTERREFYDFYRTRQLRLRILQKNNSCFFLSFFFFGQRERRDPLFLFHFFSF